MNLTDFTILVSEIFKDILKGMMRRKTAEDWKPVRNVESVDSDKKTARLLCSLILGSMSDSLLDIIYEQDVPYNLGHPLLSLTFTIVFMAFPSAFVYGEIMAAAPKRSTLYGYCYIYLNEISAFFAGWIMIGCEASRIATSLGYVVTVLIQSLQITQIVIYMPKVTGMIFCMVYFVATDDASMWVTSLGMVIKIFSLAILLGHGSVSNWNIGKHVYNCRYIIKSSFTYTKLYYVLPAASSLASSARDIKIIVREIIISMCLAIAFQVFFFLVLTTTVPFYTKTHPWTMTLFEKWRPESYIIILSIGLYASAYGGIYSMWRFSSSNLIEMSNDGLMFASISTSEIGRKCMLLTITFFIFLFDNEEIILSTLELLNSINLILAGSCLLFVRCGIGSEKYNYLPVTYPKYRVHMVKVRWVRQMRIIKRISIAVLVISCVALGASVKNIFVPPYYSVLTQICICVLFIYVITVSIGLLFLPLSTSVPTVKCPLFPLTPVILIIFSSANIALKKVHWSPVLFWFLGGFIFYLWYGQRSVEVTLREQTEPLSPRVKNEPVKEYKEAAFEILKCC